MPGFISEEAKHLLSSMIVVDPLKRSTIAEIQRHAWYVMDLPEYLRPLPEVTIETSKVMDEEIVRELVNKMGLSQEVVRAVLNKPLDVKLNRDERPIRVAYQLALDNKRLTEGLSSSCQRLCNSHL